MNTARTVILHGNLEFGTNVILTVDGEFPFERQRIQPIITDLSATVGKHGQVVFVKTVLSNGITRDITFKGHFTIIR